MRISNTWDVAESVNTEDLEGATAALEMVEQAADRVLDSRAFAVALAYALSLPSPC